MDEKKLIKYAKLAIENADLKPKLADILSQIEELKEQGRKLNSKIEDNSKRQWDLARELGMVKTTTVPQGKISEAFCRSLEKSAKKNYVKNILK